MTDNHHSSLLRPGLVASYAPYEDDDDDTPSLSPRFPFWNIEVCPQCRGEGTVPSGVEYMGQSEIIECDICYGIGYTNERIVEILDHLENLINDIR